MKRLGVLVFAAGVACASAAAAQDDGAWCRNGMVPGEAGPFALARVTAPRAHFRGDMDGCPNDEARCQGRAYVVAGDLVLTSRTRGGFVCAYFPGKTSDWAGWVKASELTPAPTPQPKLEDWVGSWGSGDDKIEITLAGGQLAVSGEAYWPAAAPAKGDHWPDGWPHEGGVEAKGAPDGTTLRLTDANYDGCKLTLRLIGPYLMASDSGECGGANVRFDGVYRKGPA